MDDLANIFFVYKQFKIKLTQTFRLISPLILFHYLIYSTYHTINYLNHRILFLFYYVHIFLR